MRFEAEITYPGATPDEAFALVREPEFRAAVCEATAALDYQIDVDVHEDESATVRQHRTMPAQVPDFVRRFVGQTIGIAQVEEWTAADPAGRRTADLSLSIESQPAHMDGAMVLETAEDGARQVVTGDLRVSIPLVGRRVEAEIAKGLVLALEIEQKTGREWLAR